jgi:FdhD protein
MSASEPTAAVSVFAVSGAEAFARSDRLAVEEPLEIRLRADFADFADFEKGSEVRTLSLTMRTPSARAGRQEDAELALGFLFTEGLLRSPQEVAATELPEAEPNVVVVSLQPGARLDWRSLGLERHFFTTSACGVCGKSALEALAATPAEPVRPAALGQRMDHLVLHQLPPAACGRHL